MKLIFAIVLTCVSLVFSCAVIGDFKHRRWMVKPWEQLALGATIAIASGVGAYYLY